MGTPSYMAPEQAEDSKQAGPAADVYALGAILYEMLDRPAAVQGGDAAGDGAPGHPRRSGAPTRLVPRVARDLETICLKCLAKDPLKRYASALALADDLQRYLDGEPIHARPASPLGTRDQVGPPPAGRRRLDGRRRAARSSASSWPWRTSGETARN